MNEDLKKAFIKEVHAARSRYTVDVFADMVRAMAIAIESPLTLGERHAELEDEFEQIKAKYEPAEFEHFYRAFALVTQAMERTREDFLGHALENLGAANTHNGQFLTPVHLSRFIAKVSCRGLDYTPGKIIPLSDPACGSSVLMIEGAEAMIADGVRQADILILAGDIDGRACDISYVQLSLLGYAACIQHMDALSQRRISPDRYTPCWYLHSMPMRCVLRHEQQQSPCAKSAGSRRPPDAAQGTSSPQTYQQLDLFGAVA